MNTDYQSQIENDHMKRRLLMVDHIPAIEDLLDKESQRLKRLQRLKKSDRLTLGDKVAAEELTELCPQICTEVNDFLGIQDGEVPTFEYFNLFRRGAIPRAILALYVLSASLIVDPLVTLVTDQNLDPSHGYFAGMGIISIVNILNRMYFSKL